jgi:hypothetical protein
MKVLVHSLVIGVALLSVPPAHAQQAAGSFGNGPPPNGEPHQPPPPAFDNCAGKAEGTSLMIKIRSGQTVQATCVRYSDGRLFSRPNQPPPFEGGQPPGGGQGQGSARP